LQNWIVNISVIPLSFLTYLIVFPIHSFLEYILSKAGPKPQASRKLLYAQSSILDKSRRIFKFLSNRIYKSKKKGKVVQFNDQIVEISLKSPVSSSSFSVVSGSLNEQHDENSIVIFPTTATNIVDDDNEILSLDISASRTTNETEEIMDIEAGLNSKEEVETAIDIASQLLENSLNNTNFKEVEGNIEPPRILHHGEYESIVNNEIDETNTNNNTNSNERNDVDMERNSSNSMGDMEPVHVHPHDHVHLTAADISNFRDILGDGTETDKMAIVSSHDIDNNEYSLDKMKTEKEEILHQQDVQELQELLAQNSNPKLNNNNGNSNNEMNDTFVSETMTSTVDSTVESKSGTNIEFEFETETESFQRNSPDVLAQSSDITPNTISLPSPSVEVKDIAVPHQTKNQNNYKIMSNESAFIVSLMDYLNDNENELHANPQNIPTISLTSTSTSVQINHNNNISSNNHKNNIKSLSFWQQRFFWIPPWWTRYMAWILLTIAIIGTFVGRLYVHVIDLNQWRECVVLFLFLEIILRFAFLFCFIMLKLIMTSF